MYYADVADRDPCARNTDAVHRIADIKIPRPGIRDAPAYAEGAVMGFANRTRLLCRYNTEIFQANPRDDAGGMDLCHGYPRGACIFCIVGIAEGHIHAYPIALYPGDHPVDVNTPFDPGFLFPVADKLVHAHESDP